MCVLIQDEDEEAVLMTFDDDDVTGKGQLTPPVAKPRQSSSFVRNFARVSPHNSLLAKDDDNNGVVQDDSHDS